MKTSLHIININYTFYILEHKCSILKCEKENKFIIDNIYYCMMHCPDKQVEINITPFNISNVDFYIKII
jgi:hypothetical protein